VSTSAPERPPALLTGWGRTAPTSAALLRPEDPAALAQALTSAGARGAIARGLGRAYGDAAQNAGGTVIDTTGLRAVRAFDRERGVLTAGAGLSLGDLARVALPHGWFSPVMPGTAHVTLGGALAADVHGKNHHADGAFSAHVESFELVTPDGERRTVTREGDGELFSATAGGMGLTGIVTELTVRLARVESDRVVVDTERARDLDDVMDRMEREDARYRHSVAWVDCLERRRLGRSVLIRGNHASAAEAGAGSRAAYAGRRGPLGVPPGVPGGLLNAASVRAFNELYYRRAPREERGRLEPLDVFFHPLDGVRDWNRLYGPRGLLQYQCVVPFGAEAVLRAILERLAGDRRPAFLAVLKRFGPGHGMLSFPAPGWTLAVDLPAGDPTLGPVLDDFDRAVAEAGGRIYLAKDSRVEPERLAAMYPDLPRWRAVRDAIDPERRLRSDLARRLGL
jgi:decaprenylphospho-beta-D-ribofuranose 2-oxidase